MATNPAEVKASKERRLRNLVFQACLVAVWSDGSMSDEERRYLTHLVETMSESEEERESLRRMILKEIHPDVVLEEIRKLGKKDRLHVFSESLKVLSSDREIGSKDRTLLKALREVCGVGYWQHLRMLNRLQKQKGIKVRWFRTRTVVLVLVLAVAAAIFIPYLMKKSQVIPAPPAPPKAAFPTEDCTNREISTMVMNSADYEGAAPMAPQQIHKAVQDRVFTVYVSIEDGREVLGSGSLVGMDPAGGYYILTNKHVVYQKMPEGKGITYEIRNRYGARYDARLDYYSRTHDLALLWVERFETRSSPLPLSLKETLKVGDPVYAVGSPVGFLDTFTAGVISALRKDSLQTDATIYFGSSGGPLIDKYGGICGVNTQTHVVKDFSFSLYADQVLEMIRDRGKQEPEKASK